jgi:hypothetical protein
LGSPDYLVIMDSSQKTKSNVRVLESVYDYRHGQGQEKYCANISLSNPEWARELGG